MAQILKIDFDLGLKTIKALKNYNRREVRDFMNGSGVIEAPTFSDNFEMKLQNAIVQKTMYDKKKSSIVSFSSCDGSHL